MANNFVLVCGGTGCESAGADEIYNNLKAAATKHNVGEDTQILKTGCFGFCEQGPIVKILPDEAFYVQVKPEDAEEIIAENILKGRVVDRLLYKMDDSEKAIKGEEGMEFYQKQVRVALRNCGFINPESIDEYIANDGYIALEKALFELKPEGIIEEIKKSRIRGRGGAGFPTWMKWNFSKGIEGDEKYVVCNADEGDPGAYMDRSALEGDPHSVIEAMIICGIATGAHTGMVYVRAEYPLAIDRLANAIEQAKEYGLLGDNILDSGFDFDLEIRYGAGAFVCGEETALLRSIEGSRGMPTPKPPFPAVEGLFKKPTIINNVETLINIPVIIQKGGEWFSSMGTEDSSGSKVFALTGKIKNSGLVEVPMGATLREIVFEIGGGIKDGKKFKAVQTGGPSGGVITEENLDTPIDFGSLMSIGSMMGSGGMIVMDEDDCIVDVTKFYLEFSVEESCGKCAPCRIGTKKLYDLLEKITEGKGTMKDIEQLKEISYATKTASLCGLGQTAPNPVLSTLDYFYDEYLEHVQDKKCRAGKCTAMVTYSIDKEKCIGCGKCAVACPVDCISFEEVEKTTKAGKVVKRKKYIIDESACIKCGECYNVCPPKVQAVLIS